MEDLERPQTRGEELANSVSHGLAAVAAIAALPVLVMHALHRGTAAVVGASVFGGAAILLYLTSAVYHALPEGSGKRGFRLAEHCAIFVLIAGTYTPFTLGPLHGPLGTGLLVTIWLLAACGIALKAVDAVKHPWLSTGLYVAMGWLSLVAIRPLWQHLPAKGFACLVLGGAAYSVGVVFYSLDGRLRYGHFVWHLFVITGTCLHFLAVFWHTAEATAG